MTGALSGPSSANEVEEDCAVFGIAPPALPEAQSVGLFAEHLPALDAFLAIDTQWRSVSTGMGALFMGLDYAGVEAGLRLAGITLTPAQWSDFRMIEGAATAALNKP